MIRIFGYVVPIFKIIRVVILYQIRKQIQIPLIADFSNKPHFSINDNYTRNI